MKSFFVLALLITVCGCTANPTTSNPTVTQTLTLNSSSSSIAVTGTFYDVTTNTSTAFPASGQPPSGLPCSFNFTTGKHDTVEFKLNFSPATTTSFTYTLGSTSSSASSDSNGQYTSSELTF